MKCSCRVLWAAIWGIYDVSVFSSFLWASRVSKEGALGVSSFQEDRPSLVF
jgi:hypothetical protein